MWRHLGSLAFLLFVVCLVSGVYLYVVFDTSVAGAYESGLALTQDRVPLGRLARGLHRYSADAFLLATALHLVREISRGHFRHFRAWSWLSGLVLVPLVWVAGITGYWLAWDERALFSLEATAEWLGARTWVAAMSDRFFSLVVFVHIGVPLMALAATWAHYARLSHVRTWPPAALGFGTVAALAVLALAHPAASLGPANPLIAPAMLAIDWFFFFPHVLADATTPATLSLTIVAALLALAAMPWIGRRAMPAAAVVDLANCNGCARCAADCPFGAVVMVPRSDGRSLPRQASVDPDLCAACGICAGACPSATPFRRRSRLASGIDLPGPTIPRLRAELDRALAAETAPQIVFACAPAIARDAPPPGAIRVECMAHVPPAFIDYALRGGAREVVLAGCPEDDCEYRLGDRWTRERIERHRAPALRAAVPRQRIRIVELAKEMKP